MSPALFADHLFHLSSDALAEVLVSVR